MKILKYEIMPEADLLARLKKVRLRGFDRALVYQDARLELATKVPTESLTPCQNYVLIPGIRTILELYEAFFSQFRIDIFSVQGALMFWTDQMNPRIDAPIPFLPPIVEEDVLNPGVLIVNDGMHRVYAARSLGRKINVVYVWDVPRKWPYYAEPLKQGWSAVQKIPELTEGYKKKVYRNPEDYKALFRDFNEIFVGVQKDRKMTSPEELKK